MNTGRFFFLLVVATLWPLLPAVAQKLAIDRFEETNEKTAVQHPRLDANGEMCALVKINVVDDVTEAEFGVVGNVVSKGKEKWVYIIDSQRNFKLHFAKHISVTINTRDYGINGLKGGATYVLTLKEEASQTAMPATKQNKSATSPRFSQAKSGDIIPISVNGITFNMVKVDGGTFMMGANSNDNDAHKNESPRHEVRLSDYYIGQTEVTQALWKAVMGSNPSRFKGDKLPVECVNWNYCQTFINKLNELTGLTFCLPTEAEWEFAARGGNKSQGYKYSGSNDRSTVAWFLSNSRNSSTGKRSTHEVATKTPNELGIYDMLGNVQEWCSDWYGSYSSTSQTNPTGASSGSWRIFRGGSFVDDTEDIRVSYRGQNIPTFIGYEIGLRLALHTTP